MNLTDTVEIIKDLGLTGGLILGIWALITGRIWPKSMIDKTIEAQQKASEKTAEILSQKICEEISSGVAGGVERAIIRGYLKINNKEAGG